MSHYVKEVDNFEDDIIDALAGRLNEEIIQHDQIQIASKTLKTKIRSQWGQLGIDSIHDLFR